MTVLAALLLAAQPAPAALPPERAMLEAFRAACHRVDDLGSMRADAAGSGWAEIPDDADPRIAHLTRIGREARAGQGRLSGANYRGTFGGRELFLIVSRFEDEDGIWGNGCRLYQFGAAAPVDPELLEQWMGGPPTGIEEHGPSGSRRLWEPGWRAGITLDISHVPAGSPLTEQLGFNGNILIAKAIGGF